MDGLAKAAGHVDRRAPLKAYCTGLLLPASARAWSLWLHAWLPTISGARTSRCIIWWRMLRGADEALLATVRSSVLLGMKANGPLVAWIIDDTGFVKKGTHSVGVARQYCGR